MSRSKSILIACPAKPGTRYGNRITALRWQSILRELGHRPRIDHRLNGGYDILVALHASRNADLIATSKQRNPDRQIVVALTGTDLYRDGTSAATRTSLRLADRIVVLQPSAVDELSKPFRTKTDVIYQSVVRRQIDRPTNPRIRRVIVAGHLRRVKDPFRAAMAVRSLPDESKIAVHHFGGVIAATLKKKAISETQANARYHWHGEVPQGELKRQLATCWLMVLSSKMEGGANVLSEAIVQHTPVLASRIPGSIGLLGDDYKGYFDFGSTAQLRNLLLRCDQEPGFYTDLQRQVATRANLFTRANERKAWLRLLKKLRP